MAYIYVVMGKSASGKDSIYRELVKDESLGLKEVISYTTRPIRDGEKNGREYYFVTTEQLKELEEENRIIEHRAYQTVHGVWHYFTVQDEQIDLNKHQYIMIGTLESYNQIVAFYGKDVVKPIYIEVESGERLARALQRERQPENGKYAEMCRRFLADEKDFSEEKIRSACINKRFENKEFVECLEEIKTYIRSQK